MNTRNTLSFRTAFERTFAGVIFGGTALLVMGGTIAACLQTVTLVA